MVYEIESRPQPQAETDDARWQAIVAKDRAFDGLFVTAVRSTKIYCRPSCPSRLPHRANVTFYDGCADAESAGYRACRRCEPQTVQSDVALAQRICRSIEAAIDAGDETPTLAALGLQEGLSPQHLQRVFKRVIGVSPRDYAEGLRLAQVKRRLRHGDAVTDALYDAGYGSSRGLYERAPQQLGMTPATYKRGGAGVRIGYSIANSPLGRLLVAATAKGLCMVVLRDSDAELETALTREFPAATIERDDAQLGEWLTAMLRHLSGQQPHLDLPLDVQATAFQMRVWQELRAIPYGSTRTYTQIAQALGQPTAARAVARACATNPVAIAIPCHRVVRENGDLAGYRWGIERKQALLAQERAASA